MTSGGDAVSSYVSSFERKEEIDSEVRPAAKMIQGMIMGSAMKGFDNFLRVQTIEQPRDDDGNYLDYMVIVTRSGHRVRVTVEPDQYYD